ncbi:hypothetical protein [Arthrobacter sp. zg-Y1110]|uniref:hypothetical protein n=1 Tax=Arthrobacter sp. zg-Y1110 TaxID=2886932 RepID=UPI001D146434|nr:hypothetical protein [Arthrobacter sp. zg-Y1110]MCC3289820.1 hypothetical protein [Arthrobacter sp. zg-Y1110]UWX84764.1 hypothetical protein N2K99_15115 [Arthrobacter sp. zg-Y1110]
MSCPDAETLAGAVLAVARNSQGKPFPSSAVQDLGGWGRIASGATTLIGQSALPIVANLVARDAEEGDGDAAAAVEAVADAVIATEQPSLLRDSLEALLASSVITQIVGERLVEGLEPVAAGFLRRERSEVADLASADALEVMTRLVAVGYGSHFSLLALLQKFGAPTVAPMARAVIRSVSIAVDVWPEADRLVEVVRVIGGVDAVVGGDPSLTHAVESDAAWALAMVSTVRSLRAASVQEMAPHLQDAARFFAVSAHAHKRPDAHPMLSVVEALRELVAGIVSSDEIGAMSTAPLSGNLLTVLREQIRRFSVDSSGLDHWYGDAKRVTLTAWSALADDLERMGKQLGKDGFYQAEVVIRDLLAIYTSARTFPVGTHSIDISGVQDLIQPVITSGFASKASHLSNLEEYVADLASRGAGGLNDEASAQLHAANGIIEIARRVSRGDDASEKASSGVLSTPLPPTLRLLVPAGSVDEYQLAQVSPKTLTDIAQRLDHVAAGRAHLNLVQQELFDQLREALSTSPDYKGQVVSVVDEVLLLILNFLVSRTASSAGHYKYLFDANAKEDAIQEDLYNYLTGNLGGRVEYEVSHVGGGRVDIRLKFDACALHVEMKVDETRLPLSDRTAYLKQTVTYQTNDIRIGFLVALRHKAFDPTGPPPHIKSLIGHTIFGIDGDSVPRHVIHVAVPGSRTNPSSSR